MSWTKPPASCWPSRSISITKPTAFSRSAVYPFTLPYHQPIDAIRVFLNYLGTSRYELLDTYRTPMKLPRCRSLSQPTSRNCKPCTQTTLDRAVDAEFLGLTQEEYIILTREAFWPKRYFEITQKTSYTDDVYHQKIGVRPVPEYYGYTATDAQSRGRHAQHGRGSEKRA